MDLKAEKLDIIQWLTQLTDKDVIARIKAIRSESDWWDELPDSVREEVNLALKEADNGNYLSHEEVMKEIRAEYYKA
jgi:predicted transcriptional regulator